MSSAPPAPTKGHVIGAGAGATHSVKASSTSTTAATHKVGTGSLAAHHTGYTYGTGKNAKVMRARGFGRGYRQHTSGRHYRYGRMQGSNRALVLRLRSAYGTLSRLDSTYNGHRTNAMHSIAMAISQLSNRSTAYRSTGSMASRSMGSYGYGSRRASSPTQSVSDGRMGQAMRTLQGVDVQLANLHAYNNGHAYARGHVEHSISELHIALASR